jgi:hypothetical protein
MKPRSLPSGVSLSAAEYLGEDPFHEKLRVIPCLQAC